MIVVVPARILSRTSMNVSSSAQRLSPIPIGLGALGPRRFWATIAAVAATTSTRTAAIFIGAPVERGALTLVSKRRILCKRSGTVERQQQTLLTTELRIWRPSRTGRIGNSILLQSSFDTPRHTTTNARLRRKRSKERRARATRRVTESRPRDRSAGGKLWGDAAHGSRRGSRWLPHPDRASVR